MTLPTLTKAARRSLLAMLALLLTTTAVAPAAEHRAGIGLHYWTAIDDLVSDDFDIDEDGLTGILSYQYRPGGLLSFELDLEIFPDGFGGSDDTTVSPIAFVLVGKGLYAGVGIGVSLSDDFGGSMSDPFYAARIGLELTLLPRIHLDLNINYRADAFSELEEVQSDALTLGAILRYSIGS